jgi:hypothetical protein
MCRFRLTADEARPAFVGWVKRIGIAPVLGQIGDITAVVAGDAE